MTTKTQEREALQKIQKIVAGLGENSYIGTAFEGCFDLADQNIEYDAAFSLKGQLELAQEELKKQAEEYGECPICGEMLPPADYCPECGTSWKDSTKNIEKLIASMWDETKRNLDRPDATPSQRAAWYYSHLGSLDMARQMGAITEERRLELYHEAQQYINGGETA